MKRPGIKYYANYVSGGLKTFPHRPNESSRNDAGNSIQNHCALKNC
jgi:hypothetical protein